MPHHQDIKTLADLDRPLRLLISGFCIWKAYLLAIAVVASCVGPAYDTSASLLPDHDITSARIGGGVSRLLERLTSWDAIYFVQATRRGYLFEQEWAFGTGLPVLVSGLRDVLSALGLHDVSVPLLAVGVSHVAHLLSVLVLYQLGRLIWPGGSGRRAAFVAACLHVLTPGGLFLSAPYAESTFSFLSFSGFWAFAAARLRDPSDDQPSVAGDLLRLVAGMLFGLATVFRSNGLLHGIPFAYEALATAGLFVRQPTLPTLRRGVVLGLGGLLVAAGSIVPQTVAYLRFCSGPSGVPGEDLRPWCTRTLPSIYAFVQERYWNIGLFRYWTLSNIPLFLLAAPMLFVLSQSGLDVWPLVSVKRSAKHGIAEPKLASLVQCMAAAQILLAAMAVTSYHVQIITRISSGYPVWYWWLAQSLAGGPRSRTAGGIVVFMIMYASIQGVLFTSFLPPA